MSLCAAASERQFRCQLLDTLDSDFQELPDARRRFSVRDHVVGPGERRGYTHRQVGGVHFICSAVGGDFREQREEVPEKEDSGMHGERGDLVCEQGAHNLEAYLRQLAFGHHPFRVRIRGYQRLHLLVAIRRDHRLRKTAVE
jgi:hypothetical protein